MWSRSPRGRSRPRVLDIAVGSFSGISCRSTKRPFRPASKRWRIPAGWNGDRPSHAYYSYGAHNLSGQVGQHYVFNNQTGGAKARTCTGYDGTGDCQGFMDPGYYVDKDLTPVNSIVLVRP